MLPWLLAAAPCGRAHTDLSIDIEWNLGVPAANDGRDAKRPVSTVEGEHLGVETHAVCEGCRRYRGFVLIPPIIRLIARLLDELSTVGNETRCDLDC